MSITAATLTTPEILTVQERERAVDLLRTYMGVAGPAYTGAHFETIGNQWAQPGDADDLTPADLVALATLSVEVRGSAAIELLEMRRAEFATLLRQVPSDLDLVDAGDDVIGEGSPLSALWTLVRGVGHMGQTRTSKLLARKRPRLVPVYDSVIGRQFGLNGSGGFWAGLRNLLQENDREIHHHALALRDEAGLADRLSPLRVIDVLAWMDGQSTTRPGDDERPDEE